MIVLRHERDPLLDIGALSKAYRRHRSPLSPVEVTEEFLERIASRDDDLRAMVTVTADLARLHARRATRRIADGDPSQLLGVPIVLKDIIDVRGVPTTAGSAVLHDATPDRNAVVWSQLGRAGAILLGKANTHEFAYGAITEPTRNPWNPHRMVGGSSGGNAAALSTGMCVAAVGSDTAGSIRIPANFCGVFGLKPSAGCVSARGVIPLAPSLDVVGPMAHSPQDLGVMLAAMSRSRTLASDLLSERQRIRTLVKRKRLRVGVLREIGVTAPAVITAQQRAATLLAESGALGEVHLTGFEESVMHNFTILSVEAVKVHQQWLDRRHLYTPYVRDRLEYAATVQRSEYLVASEERRRLTAAADALFDEWDVLVFPGLPFAAPRVGASRVEIGNDSIDRDVGMCRNTAFANMTGHPVIAAPMTFDDGLPIGVQLVGRRGGDAALLAIAEVLAERTGITTVAPSFAG